MQVRYLPLKIEILLENDNSCILLKTLITFTSNLIEMTVSTNVSLNSCKQYICTTIFQKYVRVFKTGKWDTVVCSKTVFLLFSLFIGLECNFYSTTWRIWRWCFSIVFPPSQDTCICCQDKMIKGHLILFYDMKYPVPLS